MAFDTEALQRLLVELDWAPGGAHYKDASVCIVVADGVHHSAEPDRCVAT